MSKGNVGVAQPTQPTSAPVTQSKTGQVAPVSKLKGKKVFYPVMFESGHEQYDLVLAEIELTGNEKLVHLEKGVSLAVALSAAHTARRKQLATWDREAVK